MKTDHTAEKWIVGHQVDLPEMLAGREARAARQQKLLEWYGAPLICFTLNVAGPVKVFPLSVRAFYDGVLAIGVKLAKEIGEEACSYMQVLDHPWGHEAYYVVEEDALTIKKLMTDIEETHPFGRLFDIDVLRPDGTKASRQEIGYGGRTCLICGEDAAFCASTRAHSVAQLQAKTAQLIAAGLSAEAFIEAAAQTALIREVLTTPKPGLVDLRNNGAHKDMDVDLFVTSARAIAEYFGKCYVCGRAHKAEPASGLLKYLRPLGIEAEREMFEATEGVNTHKGMIFSLGIICGALGRCGYDQKSGLRTDAAAGEGLDAQTLLQTAGEIAMPAMMDFMKQAEEPTHGKSQFARYGLSGIRGEAASGFRSLTEVGLPAFHGSLEQGLSYNDAGVAALLALIARVDDSNMIARGGVKLAGELKAQIAELLEHPWSIETVEALDDLFIQLNVSPGGCADLLALVYFLDLL